jgi:hypothetical protein
LIGPAAAACGGGNHSTSAPAVTGPDASGPDAHAEASVTAAGDASGDVANGTGAAADGGAGAESGGPGSEGGAGPAALPTGSLVRFANWAPDSPSAGFDVCTAAPGGLTWTGPLLGNAVRFPQVGRYVQLAAGSYDVRAVPPASTDCSTSIAEAIGLPPLPANGHITFALVGAISPRGSDPPAALVAFTDDVTAPAGQAALRFINATPAATSVDFGTGSQRTGNYAALADDVLFGQASSASSAAPLDAGLNPLPLDGGFNFSLDAALSSGGLAGAPDSNGYLFLAPTPRAGVVLSARAVGANTDLATGSGATLRAATVSTVAIVNGGSDGVTPQLLLCRDEAVANGLSACSVLSP